MIDANQSGEVWGARQQRSSGCRIPRILSKWPTLILLAWATTTAGDPALHSPLEREYVQQGVRVAFRVAHIEPREQSTLLKESDEVAVSFTLTDTASGRPLSGVFPAAWMDLLSGSNLSSADQCRGKVAKFVGGGTFGRAELDLNIYYVLTLNHDSTISVVDPLFGFGGSKLLNLIKLDGVGYDWLLPDQQDRLFVSLPERNQVAVIKSGSWEIEQRLTTGPRPMRLALQPDEAYLWVGMDGEKNSGVAIFDRSTLTPVAALPTGQGHHEIAFTGTSQIAFVTNQLDDTVSLVDIRNLAKLKDLPTGQGPISIAYSEQAEAAYVVNQDSGTITVVSGDTLEILTTIQAKPGISQIKMTPNERLALVVNPNTDDLYIIDTASNRIIQTAVLDKAPFQISFTDELAYIAHRDSEIVLMIPLDGIGYPNKPVPLVDFPGGHSPLGAVQQPSLAPAIVQASGEYGVLIANPSDHAVYFYKEGMAAPMGNFSNYGRVPRAVHVVERNLRETQPGHYETTVNLHQAGDYEVAVLIDAPRTILCFPFAVAPKEPSAVAQQAAYQVEYLPNREPEMADGPHRLRYRVDTNRPQPEDIRVLVLSSGAIWQSRRLAHHVGEGIYHVDIDLPRSGEYQAYVSNVRGEILYKHHFTAAPDES